MVSDYVQDGRSRGHLAILLCIMGALAAATFYNPVRSWLENRKPAGVDRAESKLALQAKIEGQLMHVVWDRNAPILQAAGRGVLSIRDGSQLRNITLSADQLRDANDIVYSPSTNEVELRLELTGAKISKQSQSVLVVLGPAQPASVAGQRPPIEAEVVDDSPSQRPAAGPVASRLTPAVFVKQQPGQGILSAGYIPPRPLNEIRPSLPGQLQPLIHGPVEIDVRITIDARGRVVGARPVSQSGSLGGSPGQQALFTRALLDAAMRSSFRPAQIRSQSVPSELVLSFRFRGAA